MRSAAWPSHSSGTRPRLPRPARISSTPARIALRSRPDDRVGALLDGDRPLGVLAQRQARHAERGGLLLHAAGVGQHQRGVGHQAQHLEISLRRQHGDPLRIDQRGQAETLDVGARARMQAKTSGSRPADLAQHASRMAPSVRGVVDVGRAMQRDEAVACRARRAATGRRRDASQAFRAAGARVRLVRAAASRSSRCRRTRCARRRCLRAARLTAALRSVVYSRSAIWSVSTRLISSGIARSKLRRPASTCTTGTPFLTATSAQARVELTSPTTSTHGRPVRVQHRLEAAHHLGGLHGMAARADFQVEVGSRQAQVGEQPLAHACVVVLAGVHEHGRQRAACARRARAGSAPSS